MQWKKKQTKNITEYFKQMQWFIWITCLINDRLNIHNQLPISISEITNAKIFENIKRSGKFYFLIQLGKLAKREGGWSPSGATRGCYPQGLLEPRAFRNFHTS